MLQAPKHHSNIRRVTGVVSLFVCCQTIFLGLGWVQTNYMMWYWGGAVPYLEKFYMMWYWGGAVPYLEKFYMMGVLGGVESKFWCLTQFHTLTFWGGGVKKTTLYK